MYRICLALFSVALLWVGGIVHAAAPTVDWNLSTGLLSITSNDSTSHKVDVVPYTYGGVNYHIVYVRNGVGPSYQNYEYNSRLQNPSITSSAVKKVYVYLGAGNDEVYLFDVLKSYFSDLNDASDGAGVWATEVYTLSGSDHIELSASSQSKGSCGTGTSGYEYLSGSNEGDELLGATAAGSDVYGLDGDDDIYGAAYDDYLYGGAGMDIIYGDAGNDVIYGGEDGDLIDLNAGIDVSYMSYDCATDYTDAVDAPYVHDSIYYATGTYVDYFDDDTPYDFQYPRVDCP